MAEARRRSGLATRVTLVTVAAAFVAVLIAGLVSLGLIRGAAVDQAQSALGKQADLLAATYDRTAAPRPAAVAALLRRQDIRVQVVAPGARASSPYVTAAQVAQLDAGETVSARYTGVRGGRYLVEARPLTTGGYVVLAQPDSVAAQTASTARRRLLVSLLLGLAGAALAGWLLARWLARPLQKAAAAAHRLATGSRDVQLDPEGPSEVAEVAGALNRLNGALAASEGREREFLLSVSHELRTPLTAVRGYAEALADGVVAPDDVGRTGAVMLAEAERLDRLVEDLLDLARLRAQDFRLDLTEVDVTGLVTSAAEVWRDRCRREGVELRVETGPHPTVVRTDPTRLRQIVDGLAENALRVTPSGRPIVLAARASDSPGPGVVIEVRDGGPGLTDDDLRVAFERSALYERYRGVRRVGTGFGLALVAALAARLGGVVGAGRAPEGGACFWVMLPRTG
jgi:two-component system, OmpR family, sensor kinase